MNIETANRLFELRKKNGLSQEELADKLGISRQAISKWERAEASPDTDNLILLAKLYGVTLDELFNTDSAIDLANENKEADLIPNESDSEIDVLDEPVEESSTTNEENNVATKEEELPEKNPTLEAISKVTSISVVIAYFILGISLPNGIGWSCYWVLFLLIPIIITFAEAIQKRKVSKFLYPALVAAIYCFMGQRFNDLTYSIFGHEFRGFWHPLWIIFLTIPIFYIIANAIDNHNHKSEEKK